MGEIETDGRAIYGPPQRAAILLAIAVPATVATAVNFRDFTESVVPIALIPFAVGALATCIAWLVANRLYVDFAALCRFPATAPRQGAMVAQISALLLLVVLGYPAYSAAILEFSQFAFPHAEEMVLHAEEVISGLSCSLGGGVVVFILSYADVAEGRGLRAVGNALMARARLARAVPEHMWPNRYSIIRLASDYVGLVSGEERVIMAGSLVVCDLSKAKAVGISGNGTFHVKIANDECFVAKYDAEPEAVALCSELNEQWREGLRGGERGNG